MSVSFAVDGGVGTITLDNPPANSYDLAVMTE
jgi:enoyl-CoA hydratase/carnithine racemase